MIIDLNEMTIITESKEKKIKVIPTDKNKQLMTDIKECLKDYLFDNQFFRVYIQPYKIKDVNENSKNQYEVDKAAAFKIFIPDTKRFHEVIKFMQAHASDILKTIKENTSFNATKIDYVRVNNAVIMVICL